LKKLRILFIHEVNYLKKPIFEMHEFPEHLAAKGHDVYFLHFPEMASSKERSREGWSTTILGRALPETSLTLLTPNVLTSGIIGRLVAAAIGHSIVKRAIRESSPDVIVTLAVPTFGWQAVHVAKKSGIPVVYRALDVSHLIRGGVFGPLVKMAEAFLARHASFVSANNGAMGDYISELGPRLDGIKIHFPPMALEKYRAGDKWRGRRLMGVKDSDLVALYMGSFFYFSGLAEVVQEFARLAPSKNVKLVLVGGGELEDGLRGLVKDLQLDDQILFTGFVGFDDLPDYLAAADVLINPMKKGLVSDTALPNKIIQYLAASKPVVSTNLKGVALTFEGYSGLHLVDTPEGCMTKALDLLAHERQRDFNSNHQLLDEVFGPSTVRSFETFLEKAAVSK
jgi:glycosyltransferase involved in cell wall biosynthesis